MDNGYSVFKRKVYDFLDNMPPGDAYQIEKICIQENRNKFIDCVKSYMDNKLPFDGYINFNHNYSVIYKIHPITFKTEAYDDKKNVIFI